MSRWLLNYTPQATIVRLLAISALNGWCTWGVLYLTGGSEDPRLLLPGWIVISTVRVPLPLPSCHQPDRPLDPHPPLPPNPTQNQHPQGNPRLHLSLLHRLLHLHGRPPRPAALQPHRLSRHPARHFSVAGLGGYHGAGAEDYGVWECDEGSLTRLFRFVLFWALFEGVILDRVKLPLLFSFSVSFSASFFCFFFLLLFSVSFSVFSGFEFYTSPYFKIGTVETVKWGNGSGKCGSIGVMVIFRSCSHAKNMVIIPFGLIRFDGSKSSVTTATCIRLKQTTTQPLRAQLVDRCSVHISNQAYQDCHGTSLSQLMIPLPQDRRFHNERLASCIVPEILKTTRNRLPKRTPICIAQKKNRAFPSQKPPATMLLE